MIPIYAVVSFLSYLNYRHAVYFEVIRDCYEAFAIASFFALLCHYVAPTLHDQKEAFRTLPIKNWVMPLNWMQKCTGGENKGMFRKPQSGLTWFNVRTVDTSPIATTDKYLGYLDIHLSVLLHPSIFHSGCSHYPGQPPILPVFS